MEQTKEITFNLSDEKDTMRVLQTVERALNQMLDGETKHFGLRPEKDDIFVQRIGDNFATREGSVRESIHSVGTSKQIAEQLVKDSQGSLSFHERENWVYPERSMTLKEVLQKVDGLPKEGEKITPEHLNEKVEKYKVSNNTLEVSFQENKLMKITMEKHPFLPSKAKNDMLEMASSKQVIIEQRMDLTLGG